MKRISQLVSIFVLICILSGCGSAAPAPAPAEAPALEAPVMEMPPAESVAEAMPPEAPVSESVAVAEAPIEAAPAPTATPDPLEFVRFDWKPTREQAEELYNYALPFIQDQPYFVRAEMPVPHNILVYVNCNPADLDDSVLPFLRAARDKFFELRGDIHDIIYIGFTEENGDQYSYDVWYSSDDIT